VLTRGVEQLLMNLVVARAAEFALPQVRGEYIPTAKNAMVRDFFAQFGFSRVPATDHQWMLEVPAYRPARTFIRLTEPAGVPEAEVS
jgi:predicted enzyme involved in methoxymalonyl-ACP biosynthesis